MLSPSKSFSRGITVLITVFGIFVALSIADAQIPQTSVKTVINKIDDYNEKLPAEKLYLQFDKPCYSVGDTIWFKGYILNSRLGYSTLSSRVYVDLVNDSNKVVKRYIFAAAIGVTWGNITLNDEAYHEGAYTVRAYTNWMRNFGEETYFYKSFYLANPLANPWMISINTKLSEDIKNEVNTKIQFAGLDKIPVIDHTLDIELMSGKKVLFRNNLQTDGEGAIETNFALPATGNVKNLTIVATDKKGNDKTVMIPLTINRAQDVDLQFMPEGGSLIESLPSIVGFKAVGQDGHGVDITGVVLDKEGNDQGHFESTHRGMGIVGLVPQPGEIYTAKFALANGDVKTVTLPAVKKSGISLRTKNSFDRDSIEIFVLASDDLVSLKKSYHFVAEARNVVCYGASFNLRNASTKIAIAKNAFPTGIAHLTILNDQNQPINERLVYIDHRDNLNISIESGKNYSPRDSIPMTIKVTDKTGNPIAASFSLAVTDDSQIKTDQESSGNIVSRMLLSSDLKGYIEDPAYYLRPNNESWKALDALLLTQGWVGYNWVNIIGGAPKPKFKPEPEFEIEGKVTNLLNRPMANTSVLLLGDGKYKMLRDTLTNNDGQFVFDRLPLIVDSTKFVLSAHTKGGRTIKGGISMNDPTLEPVTALYNAPVKPWNVNTDSTLLNYVKTNNTYRFELDRRENGGTGRLLNAVNIRDRAVVKNSQNLNGSGNSDQTLTTADMEAAGKASLLDVIKQKIKGFHEGYRPRSNNISFFIKDKSVRFVIDGIDMDRFYQPTPGVPNDHYEYLKATLDYITAEDLLGIEVLYSSRYVSQYNNQNLTGRQLLSLNPAGGPGSEIAFLEITTRAGAGPFTRTATGVYIYKPRAVTLPLEFYSPKYLVKTVKAKFQDLRSTIYWKNEIITNKMGEAKVLFYAADRPTTYTLILEGSNLMGQIGYLTDKITIGRAQ